MNSSGIWHILPFPPASEERSPNLFCMYWWFCSLGPRILLSQLLCRRHVKDCTVQEDSGRGHSARCPSGKNSCGCIWQLCCYCLVSLLNRAPLFIPVHSLLATCTAPSESWFVITSLWYTPSSTFGDHLTLWAHPKCRRRSSAGPSLSMAVEIFRSSVVFFLIDFCSWQICCCSSFIFPQNSHRKQQAARRICLAV